MPIHQISVAPIQETASDGKSAPRSKDKHEGEKAPGRSGSRSSNISKASSSTTGLGTASQTSVTPSSQDICSSGQLARLEEDVSDGTAHSKHTTTAVMTFNNSESLGSSAQSKKKQVKRRHRRKRDSCSAFDSVDTSAKQDPTDRSDRNLSSDRSERGEKRERASRPRRELPPRNRSSAPPHSDSSSEGEGWREARSWSKEKARRGRRRSGSSRERDGVSRGKGGDDKGEVMELQSIGSDEGKENQVLPENGGSLKKRRRGKGSVTREGRDSQRESPQQRDEEQRSQGYKSRSLGGSSSLAEEGEELITKRYQERGSGGGDLAEPTPRKHCEVNGGTVQPCSDYSELEVCRICHCEGDEECPLITPCWCTGSLRFVHQSCLNQWIKSSDTRCCELCKFDFIMEAHLKPLRKWEKLEMSKNERRKIFCSVLFHLIAIGCVLWSVYVLVKRTAEEIRLGRSDEFWRITLLKFYTPEGKPMPGILEWPFWTKLIVVAIGFTGGLIFMYIQCKVYLQLWCRLKAFNRIITVQNCPEKGRPSSQAPPTAMTNGKHETVAVPISSAPVPVPVAQSDSDNSVEAAVAPV